MIWEWFLEPFRLRPYEGGGGLRARALHRGRSSLQKLFLFAEFYWVVGDLERAVAPPTPKLNVEIRQATLQDLPLFVRKRDEVKANFAAGDLCFVAVSQGQLAYSRWVVIRPIVERMLGLAVTPKPGEGYLFDAFANPRFRGGGLHAAVTGYAMAWLRERGYHSVSGLVLTTNAPARSTLARLGLTVRQRITFIRFAGRRWLRRVPCRDRLAP